MRCFVRSAHSRQRPERGCSLANMREYGPWSSEVTITLPVIGEVTRAEADRWMQESGHVLQASGVAMGFGLLFGPGYGAYCALVAGAVA